MIAARRLALLALSLAWACHNPPGIEPGSSPYGRPPGGAGPAPVVVGTALDARTGKPLADVRVQGPGGVETRSDARGRFVLRGLQRGAAGELVATAGSGLAGRNTLRPLEGGTLEVVIYLR